MPAKDNSLPDRKAAILIKKTANIREVNEMRQLDPGMTDKAILTHLSRGVSACRLSRLTGSRGRINSVSRRKKRG
jgi:hypothetical protein